MADRLWYLGSDLHRRCFDLPVPGLWRAAALEQPAREEEGGREGRGGGSALAGQVKGASTCKETQVLMTDRCARWPGTGSERRGVERGA